MAVKVRIKKSSHPSFWYAKSIGRTYEVETNPSVPGTHYRVVKDFKKSSLTRWRYIRKDDCEVVS